MKEVFYLLWTDSDYFTNVLVSTLVIIFCIWLFFGLDFKKSSKK